MNTINLLDTIKNDYKGVFRTYDIEIIENSNIKYSSLVANRLVEHGYAKRAGRNKFYLPGTDIFAIASNILEPSYIGISAAFSYYNLVTQIYDTIYVISSKRHKDIEIEGYKIKFITLKNTKIYGYHIDKNTYISISDPEKAIVDSVYLANPPIAYIEEALDNGIDNKLIDIERLLFYSEKIHSKKTYEIVLALINKRR